MLAGAAPFHAKAAMAFMRQHMVAEPPPLRGRVPEVSKELNELVHCMLAKEPQARPDMAQVMEQLRKIQSSSRYRDTLLVPEPPRRPPAALWLTFAALAVVGLLGTLWLSWGRIFPGPRLGPGSPPGPALPAGPSLPGPVRPPPTPVPSPAAPVLPGPPLGPSADLSGPRTVPPLPPDGSPERARAAEPLDGGAPPDSGTPEPTDLESQPRVDPEPSPPEPVEPPPNRHPPSRPPPRPVAHPVKRSPSKPPAQRPEARHRGGKRGKRSHSR